MSGKAALSCLVSPWRIHEYDPWSPVHPLCAVSAVPAYRVGRRRRLWRARTPGLDPAADRAVRATAPSTPGSVPTGTAARLASALKGWQKLRFEVTEEATSGTEAERYSYTPTLGVFHAITGIHGDIMMPEDRIRQAMADRRARRPDLVTTLDELLGKAWDAELEPFRYAGDGAPVRWLHEVV